MKEIGYYRIQGADTWSAKTPHIDPSGDFYLYGNDIARGLDVYQFKASGEPSQSRGSWMSAGKAKTQLALRPALQVKPGVNALFCLVR